jgi:hypothetical protein
MSHQKPLLESRMFPRLIYHALKNILIMLFNSLYQKRNKALQAIELSFQNNYNQVTQKFMTLEKDNSFKNEFLNCVQVL